MSPLPLTGDWTADRRVPFAPAFASAAWRAQAPGIRGIADARRERPGRNPAAEQRDELAPFHCLKPPVLPRERIAHLGAAADGCVHPTGGRNEMIAVTPPIIFPRR
jgi:hypothetical protein